MANENFTKVKIIRLTDELSLVDQNAFSFSVGIVGPQGPQGPQGLVGPQGPKGDIGPAGPAGTVTDLSNICGVSLDASAGDFLQFDGVEWKGTAGFNASAALNAHMTATDVHFLYSSVISATTDLNTHITATDVHFAYSSTISATTDLNTHITATDVHFAYSSTISATTDLNTHITATDVHFAYSSTISATTDLNTHVTATDVHFLFSSVTAAFPSSIAESSINHSSLVGAGTYSHSDIDNHIIDTAVHFMYSSCISATTDLALHIGDTSVHFLYSSCISATNDLVIHTSDTSVHFMYSSTISATTDLNTHITNTALHFEYSSTISATTDLNVHTTNTALHFAYSSISAVVTELSNICGVTLDASAGDFLQFDGLEWKSTAAPATITSLSSIGDVNGDFSAGDFIRFDGSAFHPTAINVNVTASDVLPVYPSGTAYWGLFYESDSDVYQWKKYTNQTSIYISFNAAIRLNYTTLEKGQTLSTVVITISSMNQTDFPITGYTATLLNGSAVLVTSLTGNATSATYNPSATFGEPVSFVMTVFSGPESSCEAASISWVWKKYWGCLSATVITGSDVVTLTSQALATTRAGTLTFNASGGRYLYICWPTTFGTRTAFTVGGLATSFIEVQNDVCNTYSATQNYYTYRSQELQFGTAITVVVT